MSAPIRFPLATSSEVSIQHFSTLTLKEGKNLLQQLPLGSQDYLHLQNLLVKTTGVFEITIKNISYKINTISAHCHLLGGFGGSEHFDIGKTVQLQSLHDSCILPVGNQSLEFSHIVALAGDFYGVPNEPISLLEGSDEDKTMRFEKAFQTLNNANVEELQLIIHKITEEHKKVSLGGLPHHCYSQCNLEGMSSFKEIKPDYEDLLTDNSDHFEKNAKDAYRIGHNLALKVARDAGREGDQTKLKKAYALEAFACHFLTDLFAAGHIRNQRGDLEKFLVSNLTSYKSKLKRLSPEKLLLDKIIDGSIKKLAGILTAAQHEVDGKNGLYVRSKNSQIWISYGDGSYFSKDKTENRQKVIEATQVSVDEIHHAYINYDRNFISCIEDLIPEPIPFNTASKPSNDFPIYEIKDGSLILYENCKIKPLREGLGLVKDIVAHALTFLPQPYINDFVPNLIKEYSIDKLKDLLHIDKKSSPWISKLAGPIFRKVTGACWRVLGIATYDQVETATNELKEMIDEAATADNSTHANMQLVLEEINNTKKILDVIEEANWKSLKETKLSIETLLRHLKHEAKCFPKNAPEGELYKKTKIGELYTNLVTLSELLTRYENGKCILLTDCQKRLRDQNPNASEQEVMLRVALWFQDIIKMELEAFSYYCLFNNLETNDIPFIKEQTMVAQNFFNDFDKEKKIIESSSSYIALQLKKITLLKTASFDPKNEK